MSIDNSIPRSRKFWCEAHTSNGMIYASWESSANGKQESVYLILHPRDAAMFAAAINDALKVSKKHNPESAKEVEF